MNTRFVISILYITKYNIHFSYVSDTVYNKIYYILITNRSRVSSRTNMVLSGTLVILANMYITLYVPIRPSRFDLYRYNIIL